LVARFYRVSESEVSSGIIQPGQATIRVHLTGAHTNDVTVDYQLVSGNGFVLQAGSDYATPDRDFDAGSAAGTLTFPSGRSDVEFTVRILDDNIIEFNEDFRLMLSNPSGKVQVDTNEMDVVVGANDQATVTILFDDGLGPRDNGDRLQRLGPSSRRGRWI